MSGGSSVEGLGMNYPISIVRRFFRTEDKERIVRGGTARNYVAWVWRRLYVVIEGSAHVVKCPWYEGWEASGSAEFHIKRRSFRT